MPAAVASEDFHSLAGRMKDYFVEGGESLLVMTTAEFKEDNNVSLDRLSGGQLRSIMKSSKLERGGSENTTSSPIVDKRGH